MEEARIAELLRLAAEGILKLEAETRALKLMCGVLLANNKEALASLTSMADNIDELTLPQSLTETQRVDIAEMI